MKEKNNIRTPLLERFISGRGHLDQNDSTKFKLNDPNGDKSSFRAEILLKEPVVEDQNDYFTPHFDPFPSRETG